MAAPAQHPLVVTQGDTLQVTWTLCSDAAGTTPINITGRTYALKAKNSAGSTILTATCTVPTGTDGRVVCTASAATTGAIAAGAYAYDLEETSGSTVTTIVAGPFTVREDVS